MVMTVGLNNYSDVHYTDRNIAKHIIDHYKPHGRILEPFKGGGAFYDQLPRNAQWCETAQGRDFFTHHTKVDWIITNPPWSNLTQVMQHCFTIS
jgi:site-specific DNA-adenine methylase